MSIERKEKCGICAATVGPQGRCEGCGRAGPEIELSVEDIRSDAVGARVLVASPHPGVAVDVAERLRAQGFAPVCVSSGARSVAAFSPELPERAEAAILDVTLADLVVPSLIDHLRQDLGLTQVPIVLLAAIHNSSRYRRRATKLYGADVAIEYPHDADRIPDELARLMGRTSSARPEGGDALDEFEAAQLARRLVADLALFFAPEPLIPDGVPLEVGLDPGRVEHARAYAVRVGGATAEQAFEHELRSLRMRLASGPAARLEEPR